MALTFNRLAGSFSLSRELGKTSRLIERHFEKMASGKRITRASDDASGMAIAKALASSVRGLAQANRNIEASSGMLSTAEGAYNHQAENLQRMRELAIQAANGTLSASDRENLNAEFQQLAASVDDVANSTTYNGTKLIDGSQANGTEIQTGDEAGETTKVQLQDTRAATLGIGGLDIRTQEGASNAIDAIDSAIQKVSSARAQVGATQSRLESREASNQAAIENVAEARSMVEDLDLAEGVSENQRLSLLKEAQILASKKTQEIKGLLVNFFK